MSLILDALRKSEAERRRGQAPDLFAPVAVRIAPTAKPRIALLLIAIVAMGGAAAVVFWPKAVTPEKVAGENTGVAASLPVVETASSPPQLAASPPPARAVAAASITPTNKSRTEKPPTPEPAIAPPSAPTNEPPAAINDDAASITPEASSDAAIEDSSLPTLATLDSTTRTALPPLQLSMHVWNEDATRRFAIIDGQRLGEGGRVGAAIVVAIRRDGVVLDINGQQFLLPRP